MVMAIVIKWCIIKQNYKNVVRDIILLYLYEILSKKNSNPKKGLVVKPISLFKTFIFPREHVNLFAM